jgi:DNA invertase Pin-like site-specific DNA recombinase
MGCDQKRRSSSTRCWLGLQQSTLCCTIEIVRSQPSISFAATDRVDAKRVVAYVRVSTDEQRESRAGLDAQRGAILTECEHRGWSVVCVIEDAGYSAKDLKRPGVQTALEVLRDGRADALVVAKLDRLSRSMLDFSGIMATAQKQRWGLIALDCQVDTTTPAGEVMANVLASFAQFERRLISQRTKDALAIKKAQGVRLGRPRSLPDEVVQRISVERAEGRTLGAIAERLVGADVPTAQGGKTWYPSTVAAVLKSIERDLVQGCGR